VSRSASVPIFVPCLPQNWFNVRFFESLNRSLLCLRTNVAVAFEHLATDMSREGLDRLLAHVWVFSQPRNERVPHIMWPVTHACSFAGDSPRFAPRTHWAVEINVVEDRDARVSGQSDFVVWE
jgi:hypothetical protein